MKRTQEVPGGGFIIVNGPPVNAFFNRWRHRRNPAASSPVVPPSNRAHLDLLAHRRMIARTGNRPIGFHDHMARLTRALQGRKEPEEP